MTGPAVSIIVLAPRVGAHHRPACASGASSSVSAAAMAPCSTLQPGSCRPSSPASAAAARLCARMLSPPNDSRNDAMHSFQTGASVHARSAAHPADSSSAPSASGAASAGRCAPAASRSYPESTEKTVTNMQTWMALIPARRTDSENAAAKSGCACRCGALWAR